MRCIPIISTVVLCLTIIFCTISINSNLKAIYSDQVSSSNFYDMESKLRDINDNLDGIYRNTGNIETNTEKPL